MAAFTSKAAGNWSSSGQTTWNEVGVPGSGDTVTITHAITVDVNTTVGVNGSTSLTFSAALTVANGVTFTVKGNVIQGNAAFNLGTSAGASLVFDTTSGDVKWLFGDAANFTVYANCGLNAFGTSGSHATVSKTGSNYCWFDDFSENSGAGADKTGYDCTYCDFSGIGKSDGSFSLAADTFGNKNIRFSHCTFDSCGTVLKCRPYTWSGSANKDYYFRDCNTTNSTGTYAAEFKADGSSGSGAHDVKRNSFDKAVNENSKIDLQDNLFRHGTAAAGTLLSNTGNLYRISNGDTEQVINQDTSGCYWLAGLDHPGNPHCFNNVPASKSVTGNIFEFPIAQAIDSGECVYSINASVTVSNNLAIPSAADGKAIGNIAHHAGTAGAGWTVEHNTVVGTNNAYAAFTEASSNPAAPLYVSVKSNLVVSSSGATAAVCYDAGLLVTDMVTAANVSKNGKYNPISYFDATSGQTLSGYRAHFTSAPGGDDITADPGFADSTRNFQNWAVHKGAASSGDSQTTKTNAGLALLDADPTLIRTDLIPWIQAGFAPTNSTYRNAGHDSVTVGAIEGVFGGLSPYFGDNALAGGFSLSGMGL